MDSEILGLGFKQMLYALWEDASFQFDTFSVKFRTAVELSVLNCCRSDVLYCQSPEICVQLCESALIEESLIGYMGPLASLYSCASPQVIFLIILNEMTDRSFTQLNVLI